MITSTANETIKRLVRLRQRRHRDGAGSFLIEGYRELWRAAGSGIEIERLYISPELFLGENEDALVDAISRTGARVVQVAAEPFRKASYRDRPEGLLAEARQFDTSLDRLDLTGAPLILVVESIEKPGNLGTMLRTADAAGCRAVVVCDATTDLFNPNVVRASLGTLFTMPVAVAESRACIRRLSEYHIDTVATTPDTSQVVYDLDLTGPVALVIGSEQYGLSDAWLSAAAHRGRIPMAGSADSLNAAMAAAIVLFEAVRQRRSHGAPDAR